VKSKDQSHGLTYIKYFTVLLQEVSVDVDEDLLFSIIEFLNFKVPGWGNDIKESNWSQVLALSDPHLKKCETQMYFEIFHLQPIKVNFSFVRTKRINQENIPTGSHNPLSFVLNVLTMGLANVHDAPITMNALIMQHPIVSMPDLTDRIIKHYSQEVIGQIHKILGSADFLGNPVGLFNNISSGVVSIFYEPYQGIVSDRPQDFGIGLAKGTANFVKLTVYGLSDTFSRFTGSIGKGLSAATMDEDFQKRRSMARARNRPKHAVYGVTTGAKSLAKSLVSGVTGVVTKPLEGAEKGGVEGFFKGFGKGLVGAVAKPMVGIFDLASNLSEGIKNTTTMFEENELDRVRYPRYIGIEGVLHSYSEREATGQWWLKNADHGKYSNAHYVAHLETKIEDYVSVVSSECILMIRIPKLKSEWAVPFKNVSSVKTEQSNIILSLHEHYDGRHRVIPSPDSGSAEWYYKKINEVLQGYIVKQRSFD